MSKFDLAAKLVTDSQRIFVVHAGRQRRNHRHFVDGNVAFLEVPRIDLTDAIVASKDDLRRATRRFFARLEYDRDPAGTPKPSDDLSTYSNDALKGAGEHGIFGSLSALYGRAKVGDLIVTPGYAEIAQYRQPVVHFGEVAAAFDPSDRFTGGTVLTTDVPVRKVKWLSTISRRQVPPFLERQISKPPAVREVRGDFDLNDVLKLAYSNYIYGDGSSSLIVAPQYEATKLSYLNDSSDLIATLIAGYAFAHARKAATQVGDLAAFKAKYLASSGIENVEINFNSPGHWRIVGGSVALAMFVAVGITALASPGVTMS